MLTSACGIGTSVEAVELLFSSFGSGAPSGALTVAVLLKNVPGAAFAGRLIVNVNVALVPAVIVELAEQWTFPLLPAPGSVQVHPAGDATETNVVPAGS